MSSRHDCEESGCKVLSPEAQRRVFGRVMFTAEPVVPASSPVTRIRERIEDLRRQHANYAAYQADRVRERDHHGAWDVAINLSETECEIAGLEYALRELGVSE